jgi:GT2 family glycosyltransferase
MKKIDVIIPVYQGMEETIACIQTTAKTLPEWAELIVINDASPNEKLSKWLQGNCKKYNFNLLLNDINLGFVATVNKGMRLHPQRDVLLLNSDVEVPDSDWLTRIYNAFHSKTKVASITPFSNNATICSFPNFCEDNLLLSNVTTVDKAFSLTSLNQTELLFEVPTGVGFCMFLSRECINEIGLFDEKTYGKGYGEENDWCQRAILSGWKNYHLTNTFVFHKGGVSFAEEQDERVANAQKTLDRLYPDYHRSVMSFINQDPSKIARLNALIRLYFYSDKSIILHVAHGLGGGVIENLKDIDAAVGEEILFLTIQPIENNLVKLQFGFPGQIKDALSFDCDTGFARLVELLTLLNVSFLHVHHTLGLPKKVLSLASSLNIPYKVTVHDYYWINENPTLTDSDGTFIGDELSFEQIDMIAAEHYKQSCLPSIWRQKSRLLFDNAEQVIFPSTDCYLRFSRYFEFKNAVVAWHPDNDKAELESTKLDNDDETTYKVLVLGALSREKGGSVLEEVTNRFTQNKELEFHLLGYAYKPLDNVIEHGPYQAEQIDELIKLISPDVIWFPALWPETYSYTLSAALRSSAKIIAPNIGAFTERLKKVEGATVIKFSASIDEYTACFLKRDFTELLDDIVDYDYSVDENFYHNDYLPISLKTVKNLDEHTLSFNIKDYVFIENSALTLKERLLKVLLRLQRIKLISKLTDFIPYSLQLWLKNKLSKRAIQDITK